MVRARWLTQEGHRKWDRKQEVVGILGRNPLSSRTPKTKVFCFSTGPDFSPDTLPASRGALAPFRLCSRSPPQSSPWDLTSEAQASAPTPHLDRKSVV